MKRLFLLLLCLSLLTACGAASTPAPTVFEKDGYTIDKEKGTITKGDDVYVVSVSGGSSFTDIKITYPNGATYWWKMHDHGGYGGWSDDYDPERYVQGDILIDLLSIEPPKAPRQSSGNPLAGLLLLAGGAFEAAAPQTAWYLSYGWRFKDAEPSDAALVAGRVGGVIACILGLLLLFL